MLTRDYKSSAPGEYYHAYNRGNAKEPVFLDDDDYRFFLLRLDQNLSSDIAVNRHFRPLPPNSFSLISYCLMPNHFHLLLRQDRDIPTSKLIGKICTSYSMYFNKKYGRVGHVFQDQFKQSHASTNRSVVWLSAYIHNNPVKASLVKYAADWSWSSYRNYTDNTFGAPPCKTEIIMEQFKNSAEYATFSAEALEISRHSFSEALLLDNS